MLPATTTKQELLDFVAAFDVAAYAKTRNHLKGTVSRLSPFITRGVITLPEIRQVVLSRYSATVAEKFIQELAWREYWQQVWFAKGEAIFSDLRFPRADWAHNDLVAAIVRGQTEIPVLDDAITALIATGYMHNHARMWVAMLACNVAKANLFAMSRWLYYHLHDGDLASNMLSWQWIAGTNASKRYVANQAVINSCSDHKELRTYLTMPREKVGEGGIPTVLKESIPFTYTMEYPPSDVYDETASTVFLYSPWTLNPDWRKGEEGERVLLIEPMWFDRFPISPTVLNFIMTVARTQIPGIKVVVANVSDLTLSPETAMCSQAYPAHTDWPGTVDAVPRLFPLVTGYYPSFFKFWEACQKTVR
jgi:deoxyribodipyrimidine photo-lyase